MHAGEDDLRDCCAAVGGLIGVEPQGSPPGQVQISVRAVGTFQ